MVRINNDIGNSIKCSILYKDEFIGECTNILSFYDILCQIKNEKSNDYKISIKNKLPNGDIREHIYKVNQNGRLSPLSLPNVMLWDDIFNKQLLYLTGYTNNVIYESQKII